MAEAETVQRVKIPAFEYGGFMFPGGEVAVDIENLDTKRPAYELHKESVTLAELRGLYEVGLASKMGDNRQERPQGALEAALLIYENCSRRDVGEWTDDAVDYSNGKNVRGILVPEGYAAVRWVKHPVFKREGENWEVLLGENAEEFYIFLPPKGCVIPTMDGLYRPGTGAPFATVKDREEAIRLLEKAGLDGRKEASYFWRRDDCIGVAAIRRWFYSSDFGAFDVDATEYPDHGNSCLGSRPIIRSK